MRILQGVFYFLLILLAALLLAALVAPSTKVVKRSVVIEKSPAHIYNEIADFKNWEKWDPRYIQDSGQLRTYRGSPSDIKQSFSWKSKNKSSGKVTRKDQVFNESFYFTLETDGMSGTSGIVLEEVGRSTQVTWTLTSELAYPQKFLHYFIEKWVGPDIEKGLKNLEKHTELLPENELHKIVPILRKTVHGRSYVMMANDKIDASEENLFRKIAEPKVAKYIQTNGLVARGPAQCMYYDRTGNDRYSSMAVALPLEPLRYSETSIPLPMGDGTLASSYIACRIDLRTNRVEQAKNTLSTWLSSHSKKLKYPILVEYSSAILLPTDTAAHAAKVYYFFE